MTQYQQVLAAVKALGNATPKQIYEEIKKTHPEWGTKTPIASISGYLSRNTAFKKNDDGTYYWQEDTPPKTQTVRPQLQTRGEDEDNLGRGLYFITLSPYIKIPGAGFLFKIGKSDKAKKRLEDYSRSLPVDTVQAISFYPIPQGVDLSEAEKQVNGELLGNEELGVDVFGRVIAVRPYYGNHQREWLQTLDITLPDENSVNKLAKIVDAIVKATIDTLTAKPVEEVTTDE